LYQFLNIKVKLSLTICTDLDNDTVINVKPNDMNHPLLTVRSHAHPIHVIINACKKFAAWDPPPTDAATLDLIQSVWQIFDALNDPAPSAEFIAFPQSLYPTHDRTPSELCGRKLDDREFSLGRYVDPELDNKVKLWQSVGSDTPFPLPIRELENNSVKVCSLGPLDQVEWKPSWDMRWSAKERFSSNDWAFYQTGHNLMTKVKP
jgi:hypothetical protein